MLFRIFGLVERKKKNISNNLILVGDVIFDRVSFHWVKIGLCKKFESIIKT